MTLVASKPDFLIMNKTEINRIPITHSFRIMTEYVYWTFYVSWKPVLGLLGTRFGDTDVSSTLLVLFHRDTDHMQGWRMF